MFDFFKEMYAEINHLDRKKILEEREKVKQKKKADKIYLGKLAKAIIYFMGILYLMVAISSIVIMFDTGLSLRIIKYIILSFIDIAALILLRYKKKDTELAAIVLIAIFVILNMLTTLI